MDGIFSIFFCFQKRAKEEVVEKKPINISNSTIFTILEENQANQDQNNIEARKIIEKQADISIFDFDKLKEFFDTQFEMNQEIEQKYVRNQQIDMELSINKEQSQYNSQEMMRNSQMSQNSQILKRIEDLEKMKMTQSVRKNYMNANFLNNSTTRLDISYYYDDYCNKDINMMSEEHLIRMIDQGQVQEMVLESLTKKQLKYKWMLQNATKINNNRQFYLIDSEDYLINTKEGCICKNQNIIDQQKNLIYFLLKQYGTSMFSKSFIANVQLPISICQSETILTRIAKSFLYIPNFLFDIINNDYLHLFKKSIAMIFSINSTQTSQYSSLVSMLGETHSAYIIDNNKNALHFQAEQIQYFPPISQIYLSNNQFRLYGNLSLDFIVKLNHIQGICNSHLKIDFLDSYSTVKQEILVTLPQFIIKGTLWGQRSFNFQNITIYLDLTNFLLAIINFGDSVQSNSEQDKQNKCLVSGNIYLITQNLCKTISQKIRKNEEIQLKDIQKEDLLQEISIISGSWVDELYIDKQLYWSRKKSELGYYMVDNQVLLSDSIFRLDLHYIKINQYSKAQSFNYLIEDSRKKDQILRNNFKLQQTSH